MVLGMNSSDGLRQRTVLWAVPVPDMGGVARHVLDAAQQGLPDWRLVVLCPEGSLADRLRGMGAAVLTGEFGPGSGFRQSLFTLRRHIRHLRPEIVHSHLAYADVVAAVAVLGTKVRLVTTEHGIARDDGVYHGSAWKSGLKMLLHRARLKRADALIAVSEATKDAMMAKWRPKQAIAVIPNGVNSAQIREHVDAIRRELSDDSGLRVLSLSRLAPEKGLDTLLEAFALVLQHNPGAQLTVAGEGPDRLFLESYAAKLGISTAVDFPGFVEPLAAMANADVLVQLSVWENCSYTLLDAVSARIGIVATAVGGNPEIVRAESLVDESSPEAVARSILLQTSEESVNSGDHSLIGVGEMVARISTVYEMGPR